MSASWKARVVVRDWVHVARAMARAVLDRTGTEDLSGGTGTAIVMIPGIWEPWRFLLPLARRLHALGHPVHPLPALGWNGRPLDDSVERARRNLATLAERGITRAVLVAHSKGGLVGALLLAEDPAPVRVDGLVALCSPFGGSTLARPIWRRTPLGMFEPDGADVRRIAALTDAARRIVSIGSRWDEMIPQGTRLAGATHLTLEVPGHFLPLADDATAHLVHEHVEALAGRD